jgi:cell wall-associated NlpC family hydrolase
MLRIPLLLTLLVAMVWPVAARADDTIPSPETPKPVLLGTRAAQYAKRFVGVRYTYGGMSPRTGFDCSGLVAFVYRHFGVQLPHFSGAQFAYGHRVVRGAWRPGDLVFFNALGHVGIYIGNGRFVEATHPGGRVQVSSIFGGWYAQTYDGARRIFAAA